MYRQKQSLAFLIALLPVACALCDARSETARPAPPLDMSGVKSVRLLVDQSYAYQGQPIEGISLPIESTIRRIGAAAGFAVADGGTADSQATLTIVVRGKVLSKTYGTNLGIPLGTRHSGASVNGTITLQTSSGGSVKREFDWALEPPDSVGGEDYTKTEQAPFAEAAGVEIRYPPYDHGLSQFGATHLTATLLDMVREQFGAKVLKDMLRATADTKEYPWRARPSYARRESAWRQQLAYALARQKKEETVALLASLLQVDNAGFRATVVDALGLLGSPAAVSILKSELLSDHFSAEREWNLPLALTRIDHPSATSVLVAGFSTKYRNIHIKTAELLAKRPVEEAVPDLIGAGTSGPYADDDYIKSKYALALKRATGQDFGTDFSKWADLLAHRKSTGTKSTASVVASSPKSAETAPTRDPDTVLPPFAIPLKGRNEVRVKNPNEFAVTAGIRAGERGTNFAVPANGRNSVYVPDGRYDIYFVYSTEPDALFKGDGFTLDGNGVEIQIVKVVGGNYGIRRVK